MEATMEAMIMKIAREKQLCEKDTEKFLKIYRENNYSYSSVALGYLFEALNAFGIDSPEFNSLLLQFNGKPLWQEFDIYYIFRDFQKNFIDAEFLMQFAPQNGVAFPFCYRQVIRPIAEAYECGAISQDELSDFIEKVFNGTPLPACLPATPSGLHMRNMPEVIDFSKRTQDRINYARIHNIPERFIKELFKRASCEFVYDNFYQEEKIDAFLNASPSILKLLDLKKLDGSYIFDAELCLSFIGGKDYKFTENEILLCSPTDENGNLLLSNRNILMLLENIKEIHKSQPYLLDEGVMKKIGEGVDFALFLKDKSEEETR